MKFIRFDITMLLELTTFEPYKSYWILISCKDKSIKTMQVEKHIFENLQKYKDKEIKFICKLEKIE